MSDNTTPRPWAVRDHLIYGGGYANMYVGVESPHGRLIAHTSANEHPIDEHRISLAEAQANAELIVRAVNAYDELIKGADATLMEHAAAEEGVCVCDICSTLRPIVDTDSDAMIANGEVTP